MADQTFLNRDQLRHHLRRTFVRAMGHPQQEEEVGVFFHWAVDFTKMLGNEPTQCQLHEQIDGWKKTYSDNPLFKDFFQCMGQELNSRERLWRYIRDYQYEASIFEEFFEEAAAVYDAHFASDPHLPPFPYETRIMSAREAVTNLQEAFAALGDAMEAKEAPANLVEEVKNSAAFCRMLEDLIRRANNQKYWQIR